MNNGRSTGETPAHGPRVAAIVGPYQSGKTTLLEAMLLATGTLHRKGSVPGGTSFGDASPEARSRQMGVEMNIATADYLGDRWTFIDCPGSVELAAEAARALQVADVAVVVCEPDLDKVRALGPTFRQLDELAVPHMVFLNKMDQLAAADLRVRDLMEALQAVSQRPLVLRQVPIREGAEITGYVDLVSERAYRWRPGRASDLVPVPDSVKAREHDARQTLLEALADFDDTLLEQLLEDVSPDPQSVYRQLRQDLASDLIVPVFLGCAERDHGIRRLLKALRHEAPDVATTAARLDIPEGEMVAQVFKTWHASHAGRLSMARLWRGTAQETTTLGGERPSGLYDFAGGTASRRGAAMAGEVVGFGRLEHAVAGELLTPGGRLGVSAYWPAAASPVHELALQAENRADEVKLTSALQKLVDEDDSLSFQHRAETGELILAGQGPTQLAIALDRLRARWHVPVVGHPARVPYRETIRRGTALHSRFKRQTGGHGQFADVHVEIRPLGRGEGFRFEDRIVGGVVPRTYIPAVEAGLRDAMACGPCGFPVVDIAVALTGGQYHAVDSSEQAFRTVGRQALTEALPGCEPVLLEPILEVSFTTPSDFTPKVQRMVSQRRGQILGYDICPGWTGWDEVKAYMPQADMTDLIVELRSVTLGMGRFTARFAHLAELNGKLADRVMTTRTSGVAA